MWKTKSVCHPLIAPYSTNTCTTKDPRTGHVFNLMRLSDYNHRIQLKENKDFLINICKPTLYGHNEMCPPHSSICMDNTTETDLTKRFKNYGTTAVDPVYENGKLSMQFKSNEKCNGTAKNITSYIQFICDENVEVINNTFFAKIQMNQWIFDFSSASRNSSAKETANIDLHGWHRLRATDQRHVVPLIRSLDLRECNCI